MEETRPQDVVAAGYDRIAARYAGWRKQEPEGEVRFHWLLAQKPIDR